MDQPLYYAIDSLAGLDANLKQRSVENFIEALHRRMRQHQVQDPSTLPDPKTCLLHGPQGTLLGLKQAVEAGIADNFTFHFAFTALVLYMELEQNPELLARIRSTPRSTEWVETFQKYCKRLADQDVAGFGL